MQAHLELVLVRANKGILLLAVLEDHECGHGFDANFLKMVEQRISNTTCQTIDVHVMYLCNVFLLIYVELNTHVQDGSSVHPSQSWFGVERRD